MEGVGDTKESIHRPVANHLIGDPFVIYEQALFWRRGDQCRSIRANDSSLFKVLLPSCGAKSVKPFAGQSVTVGFTD